MHYLVIALFAFLAGFYYGKQKKTDFGKKIITRKKSYEDEKIRREYENFLNYDGTEQQ